MKKANRFFQITPANKNVLTLAEVVEYTGYSRSYLYKMTSAGIIPFSKPNNKKIFFDRQKLEEWLLSNAKPGKTERDVKAATYVNGKK